jgi:molecular chaperone DnaJ
LSRDYYIVLGISRGADHKKIKKAYRTVAKKYHPDIAQDSESSKRFLEIREAYETLSDEKKRREYDQELAKQGSRLRIMKVPDIIDKRTSVFNEVEREFYTKTDEFFEGFLPGFFDIGRGRTTGKDLFFEAILSPYEAERGGLYPITVPVAESCPKCAKSGIWDSFFCPTCNGYGRVQSERQFSLSIPPNVKHGTEIKITLEDIGLRDVYLNIMVLIDPELDEFD